MITPAAVVERRGRDAREVRLLGLVTAAVVPDPDGPWQARAHSPRVAEALRGVAP